MQKCAKPRHLPGGRSYLKLLLIMKLTALFLTVLCLQAAATGMAQETVTVSVRKTSLKKLFSIIQRQTSYRFLYHDRLVSEETRIDKYFSQLQVRQ